MSKKTLKFILALVAIFTLVGCEQAEEAIEDLNAEVKEKRFEYQVNNEINQFKDDINYDENFGSIDSFIGEVSDEVSSFKEDINYDEYFGSVEDFMEEVDDKIGGNNIRNNIYDGVDEYLNSDSYENTYNKAVDSVNNGYNSLKDLFK